MKILGSIICTISVICIVWFMANFVEIVCKNTAPNPTYSKANIIVNIIEEVTNND